MNALFNWDTRLFYQINNLTRTYPALDHWAAVADKYSLVLFGLLLLWYLFKNRRIFWTAFWSAILSRGILIIAIRDLWPRARPFVALSHVMRLVNQDPHEPSFPSGHTAVYFSLAFSVFVYDKPAGTLLILVALLFSLNRVYVGVHYPLDILGGIIVAGVAVYLVRKFIYRRR